MCKHDYCLSKFSNARKGLYFRKSMFSNNILPNIFRPRKCCLDNAFKGNMLVIEKEQNQADVGFDKRLSEISFLIFIKKDLLEQI